MSKNTNRRPVPSGVISRLANEWRVCVGAMEDKTLVGFYYISAPSVAGLARQGVVYLNGDRKMAMDAGHPDYQMEGLNATRDEHRTAWRHNAEVNGVRV
jgi:hypothetical protein